ncbi:DUF4158 domain-containing protein [Streptomyces sp. NPDC001212]
MTDTRLIGTSYSAQSAAGQRRKHPHRADLGTVRMLGAFLTEDPTAVPASVVRFVAEQLGIDEEHFAEYGTRSQTAYEHAWEIRDEYGYRDFAAGEAELREFLAARVWSSLEGPRALFDRAVVWLVSNRVLLPGVTTLARMVAAVRSRPDHSAAGRTDKGVVPHPVRRAGRLRVAGAAGTAAVEDGVGPDRCAAAGRARADGDRDRTRLP